MDQDGDTTMTNANVPTQVIVFWISVGVLTGLLAFVISFLITAGSVLRDCVVDWLARRFYD